LLWVACTNFFLPPVMQDTVIIVQLHLT
jgi:hypothetical protein